MVCNSNYVLSCVHGKIGINEERQGPVSELYLVEADDSTVRLCSR
jgi:hypothetical protein